MKPTRPPGGRRTRKQRLGAIRTFRGTVSSSAENRDSAGKRNTCWPGKCSSNTLPGETRWPALQKAGIDRLFSVALLSYPLGVRKPETVFFRLVLTAAQAPPDQVLFVGDNLEHDVSAPISHGMRAALVRPRGLRPGEVLPDGTLLIEHVRDLPALLEAM
jgi:hypothetical protein